MDTTALQLADHHHVVRHYLVPHLDRVGDAVTNDDKQAADSIEFLLNTLNVSKAMELAMENAIDIGRQK